MRRRGEHDLPVEPVEVEALGVSGQSPWWDHGRRRYLVVAVAVAVAVLAGALAARGDRQAVPPVTSGPPVTTAAPTTAAHSREPAASASTPGAPPVEVTDVGTPLVNVPAGWDLFGLSPGRLVRVELAAGRVTRTVVPALGSSGPVSLVAGPDRVVIRPLDFVAGYVVPDGKPPERLSGPLAEGGPALPGPDRDHLWVAQDSPGQPRRMILVGFDGSFTATSVSTPNTFAAADGTGGLLVTDSTGGVYLARPEGRSLVTTGALLAVGPTRWLSVECDDEHRCSTQVTDRASGDRRIIGTVGGEPRSSFTPIGVISPDGDTAAVIGDGSAGPVLHLLDLHSGQERSPGVPLAGAVLGDANQAMVWSPDSRWLFVAGTAGRLTVVDGRTATVHTVAIPGSAISQLVFRAKATNP